LCKFVVFIILQKCDAYSLFDLFELQLAVRPQNLD
jgi:hypothetical protein